MCRPLGASGALWRNWEQFFKKCKSRKNTNLHHTDLLFSIDKQLIVGGVWHDGCRPGSHGVRDFGRLEINTIYVTQELGRIVNMSLLPLSYSWHRTAPRPHSSSWGRSPRARCRAPRPSRWWPSSRSAPGSRPCPRYPSWPGCTPAGGSDDDGNKEQ